MIRSRLTVPYKSVLMNWLIDWLIDNIRMMDGSECDIQIRWIRGANVARGRGPSATFSTEVHHIWISHQRPCFIWLVAWSTTTIKYHFQLTFNFHQQLDERRSTPFARWRYNIRRLHSNNLKCMTVYHCNDTRLTVTRWSFDNDERHVTAFRPISEAARSWSYDK